MDDDAESEKKRDERHGICLGQGKMDLRALAPLKRKPNGAIADCDA